jgi:hypothetical protein
MKAIDTGAAIGKLPVNADPFAMSPFRGVSRRASCVQTAAAETIVFDA